MTRASNGKTETHTKCEREPRSVEAARVRLELSYLTRIDSVPGHSGAAVARAAANCECAISFREYLHAGGGERRRQAGDAAGRYGSEQDGPQCVGPRNRASFFVFTPGFGDQPGRSFEALSNPDRPVFTNAFHLAVQRPFRSLA